MSQRCTKKRKGGIVISTKASKLKLIEKNPYTSPFFSTRKVENTKKELYIGKDCVEIIKKQTPMDLFRRYLQTILDNTYGFLMDHNLTKCFDVYKNFPMVLAHIFKSILEYNKIQTYSNIYLCESYKSIIFGEPMVYQANDESCELKLLFFVPCIENILADNSSQSIRFSDDIIKERGFRDSLSIIFEKEISGKSGDYDDDFGQNYDVELQNILLKLFQIADHAATHFIEHYKTKTTDWINHHMFGVKLKGEIVTYCTVFDISASIVENASKPIIISGGDKKLEKQEKNNSNWDFVFNNLNAPSRYYTRPLQQIHNNIANLVPLEY